MSDGTRLYYGNASVVGSVDLGTGDHADLGPASGGVGGIAIDATNVYWTDAYRISTVPKPQ